MSPAQADGSAHARPSELKSEGVVYSAPPILLSTEWKVQSTQHLTLTGEVISKPQASVGPDWTSATVPSTLAGILSEKQNLNPYFGMNLRTLPGSNYQSDRDFYHLGFPDDSPFNVPWWYRTDFKMGPRLADQHFFLKFKGLNYSANIWLNGAKVADRETVAGTYREFEFEITPQVQDRNTLAIEIFPPTPDSLSSSWVDWNPAPPDKNTGIWHDVQILQTGPLRLHSTQVSSQIDLRTFKTATVTIRTFVENITDWPLHTQMRGSFGTLPFAREVVVGAGETKLITIQLKISSPHLWWPKQMGESYLYPFHIETSYHDGVSDQFEARIGIREITSHLDRHAHLLFLINGKPIFIRGGGWSQNLFLQHSAVRNQQELDYVTDLNLNTIRFEGQFEPESFLDSTDERGILVLPGWPCCTRWEKGDNWTKSDFVIAEASLRDQLNRFTNHASTLAWMYGSDHSPPPKIEKMYLRVFKEMHWPNPTVASAADDHTLVGRTGVKMTGPYEYVPPSYWSTDQKNGGAFGFMTETSVGPAVPPIESLRAMLPADHLWPIDDEWNFHAGVNDFHHIKYFTEALNRRYGEAHSVEEYAMKAQVLAYDGHRAMFEAYTANKYKTATGIIQWMLNNSWPSLIWHLYDFYLRPGGAYFGAKKALEPVHIQYSYNDHTINVVNSTYEPLAGLRAEIKVYDFNLNPLFSATPAVELKGDAVKPILKLSGFKVPTVTYFLGLVLRDGKGLVLSQNFYWLSTQKETLDWKHTDFTGTRTLIDADMKMLNDLRPAHVVTKAKQESGKISVELENSGTNLAFMVRLKITDGKYGEELLPVLWQDNYISLLPGEWRMVDVTSAKVIASTHPFLELSGWNLTMQKPKMVEP